MDVTDSKRSLWPLKAGTAARVACRWRCYRSSISTSIYFSIREAFRVVSSQRQACGGREVQTWCVRVWKQVLLSEPQAPGCGALAFSSQLTCSPFHCLPLAQACRPLTKSLTCWLGHSLISTGIFISPGPLQHRIQLFKCSSYLWSKHLILELFC